METLINVSLPMFGVMAIGYGALATGIVALVVVKFVFRRDLAQTTFHGFLSIYTNSGYIGIPLFVAAFGADKMLPTIIITTTEPMTFIAVVMLAMERMRYPDKPTLGRIWSVAFMLMKRPMLVVSVLGVCFLLIPSPCPSLMDIYWIYWRLHLGRLLCLRQDCR